MASKNSGLSPTPKSNKNKDLQEKNALLVPPSEQGELFLVEKQVEHDGVEMGVLANGTPYLTESGLARMCGVDRKAINRLAANWEEEQTKERGKAIADLLRQSGYTHSTLFLKSRITFGYEINAYPEQVCLALLEYYAFISEEKRPEAQRAFRALARVKFREFVYTAVGYSPEQRNLDSWRHYHDRVDLTKSSVPAGYFGVFEAIAPIIVPLISAGVEVNDRLIPDISAGRAWSEHWQAKGLASAYGERIHYEHNYPSYYPQAKSNPQEPWAYPDAALPEFKRWLREQYVKDKLPTYLISKVKTNQISFAAGTRATLALTESGRKQIGQSAGQ